METRHLLEINFAMLCIGTSGVLGRYVPLDPLPASWWRGGVALALLGAWCAYRGLSFSLGSRRSTGIVLLSGLLMGIHWLTYFYALKTAGVAVGMLAIFTYPAMTALLEPLLLRKSFVPRHLLLALLVVIGVYFLAPGLDPDSKLTQGLFWGLGSALVYALRNILLKTQVDSVQGSVLMFYQMVVVAVVGAPFLYWFYPDLPTAAAWPYVFLLGLITTALGHTLFLMSFRFFSVTTVSLLSCVQPIYGILYAFLFFGDVPPWSAAIGGAFILSAVALEARAKPV